MDQHKQAIQQKQIDRTIAALEKNNFEAHYIPTIEEVIPTLERLIPSGSTIGVGGSASLEEAGVHIWLRSGRDTFLDRYKPGITAEETREIFLKSFDADTYLTSANAVTEHGELYNVDGQSNRIAAMLWGPKQVIVVASVDKIVPSLHSAVLRVKQVAAPANATRLGTGSHCTKEGVCVSNSVDDEHLMALEAGACENNICANYVVFSRQRIKGRIKVLLVGESLGY